MSDPLRQASGGVAAALDDAREAVLDDRGETHGDITENFDQIAAFWSEYLGVEVDGVDVAMMMVLTKVSRQRCGSRDQDHYADAAGYAAIANGLAQVEEVEL